MRRRYALFALLLASCATSRRDDLASRVDAILASHPQQTIAVSYYDFATGREFHRNEKVVFHAASTMKVPVMLGIFEAVSRGELRLVPRNDTWTRDAFAIASVDISRGAPVPTNVLVS